MKETGSLERRAMALAADALELNEADRAAFITRECEGNDVLAERVRGLLSADGSSGGVLRTGGATRDAGEEPMPDRAGAYKLTGLIGRGGMGAVYLGERDTGDFELKVAVKVIRPGALSDALIARFERERQILASMNHANIASLLDGGTLEDGSPYFVMEYIEGQPISVWADTKNLSLDDRLWLFMDACGAVRYAHQNLIVHRDITPSNVLVTEQGMVKLIDFGIAKPNEIEDLSDPDAAFSGPSSTSLASMSFTPGFAAPERAEGAPANTLSDIYSLGKLMAAMLEGHLKTKDHDARAIIAKATAQVPPERYASVDALMDDVSRLRTGRVVEARGGGVGYRFGRYFARHRLAISFGSLAVLGLTSALAVSLVQYNRAETALVEANARFEDARALSRSMIFDVYDEVNQLNGSLSPRRKMTEYIRTYVDRLAEDPNAPPDVLMDIGTIQHRLSDLYGGVGIASLGEVETSYALLEDAEAAFEALLAQEPANIEAMEELAFVKRSLTNQALNYKLDAALAEEKNAQTLELTLQGVAIAGKDEQTLLRHFWSARTDRLHILQNQQKFEEALSDVRLWISELDDTMSDRLGGGGEMVAYLSSQEAEILFSLDRSEEALVPLNTAADFRRDSLERTPDNYYHMLQLSVVEANLSRAYRNLDNAEESVAHAAIAVQLSRDIWDGDPENAAGPEGLAADLTTLAKAQVMAGDFASAHQSVDESMRLHRDLTARFEGDSFYLRNMVTGLIAASEVYLAEGKIIEACDPMREARSVIDTSLTADDGTLDDELGVWLASDIVPVLESPACQA